ncbi:MAG: ATP-binding protein [Myxococcota bacterium]|nr:ATP-binding protein [Myxococcota bacterium]
MPKVSLGKRIGVTSSNVAPAVGSPAAEVAEVSAPRSRFAEGLPAVWLDRLLTLSLELPFCRGEHAVVETLVDGIAAILPHHGVGACFVAELASGQRKQVVIKRLPEDKKGPASAIDPTRIFAGLVYERAALIPQSATGSTLHVGSDSDELDPNGSAAVQLLNRAATVLGRALAHTREIDARRGTGENAQGTLLEERMMQADKLATFGQIAAGVVHELNNPLTAIVAYSDLLIRKAREAGGRDADDVERLRRVSESANRMLRFTRDLVSYARPSGSVARPVLLHAIVEQAIAFCEHVLSASGVRVERHYGAEVLTVRAVSEQLVQVFVNLLTNASQAAPARDGRVAVTTSLAGSGRRVLIVVQDNGTGIAPEHLPSIFAPFFTTKADRNGTGLGLSIVKNILENHGGAIGVESAPGLGTRFQMELPIEGP